MTDNNMTMDEFSKAIDASFSTFKDEGAQAWENVTAYKESQTNLTVTVDGIVNKGVIAQVEGIRGFIPASRLALGRVEDLNDYLGKEIQVRITEVDEEENRLILSCREILREEAEAAKKAAVNAVAVGSVLEGTVESLQSYGAFVRLSNGLSGLVHVSQISNTRIKHPSVVLSEGDAVTVKVIAVKDGKLSLSIKALQEDTEAAEAEEMEKIEIPEAESISTSLGDLLKGFKL
ncbi:MAG: S1 RNA-binding domain-containing protein [Lachnospiraceae bacterium]|nr:S1 RNA-binding domain-containing protein [Lachnospiraceae bacterium]